ncbi:hypothetical protein [Helicobacter bilis]|nr:hypothetical protein [Helicobacter bilis]
MQKAKDSLHTITKELESKGKTALHTHINKAKEMLEQLQKKI